MTQENAILKAIADAIPGGYLDAELRCRFISRAYAPSERDLEAWVGRPLREVIGEKRFAVSEPFLRAALRGEAQRFESVSELPDGTVNEVNVRYVPHLVDGVVVGIVVLIADITDSQRARHRGEALGKTLQQRVDAGDERFKRVFHSAPVGLAVRRLQDDRIVEVNDQFSEITGFSREEVIGRATVDIGVESPKMKRQRDEVVRREGVKSLVARNAETPFRTQAGKERVALLWRQLIEFGDEGPCALTTFLDITERVRAEMHLSVQRDVSRVLDGARSLEDAVPGILRALCEAEGWEIGAVWVPEPDGNRLCCAGVWAGPGDVALQELASLTRSLRFPKGSGGPGRVWLTSSPLVVADVEADGDFARGAAAGAAGLRSAVLFPIRRGDEVMGVLDFIGRAPPSDDTFSDLAMAVSQQLGLFMARARDANALRRSEARLATIIENLSEGILLVNREGQIIHQNPAALRLRGLDQDDPAASVAEIQARFEMSTLDGVVLPPEAWPIARILRGEILRDLELRLRRRDRDWQRVFSLGGSLVDQADGTVVAMLTIADITERARRDELRRVTEQLLEDNRRIEEASRLKSEFLANMSHELRTPLNAILGFVSLLHGGRVGPMSDLQRELLGDVLTSSHHLLQLVNDILDLAKVEAGRMKLSIEPTDTRDLIDEVCDVVGALAAPKRLRIEVEIDPSLAVVRVDSTFVKQILYNFLSNAIKFTPADGRLWIRALPEDDQHLRIEVEDTGIGIRAEDLGRLFVAFEQLDAGAGKRFQGTGLGLALTKKLAEAHGGCAGATSTLGVGSRFFVILPNARA